MEHILNLIEVDNSNSKIKVSITESTMMQILHRSMDKAYRKVKSKNGVLERLNEISKFYELAVMQLEGCLKFVQQETDNYDLETSQELLLEDLTEIKDRLQGRLKEVESAISDKDKELSERLGNELKLRKALEMSEKKMDSLYADIAEQKKSEGIDEMFRGSQASIETGDREDEFCELKHTVDQQVWNIQQQLEPNYRIQDEERNQGIDNKKIEQMGSDIGILKETLDLAFFKMQNAIFLSELGPMEHQWMWNIERSIAAIVIKGSLKGFRESFEDEMKKRELQASLGLRKHLSDVIREINFLNRELRFVSNPDEDQVKSSKLKGLPKGKCSSEGNNIIKLSTINQRGEEDSEAQVKSLKLKGFPKGKCFSDGNNLGKSSTIQQRGKEDSENDQGSLVAKMIKNHESIIRKKSEELDLVTRELLREKSSPPSRKEKDSIDTKRRIQELIKKLECLINLNPVIGDIFCDNRNDYELQKPPEARSFTEDDRNDVEKPGVHSMEEIWAKVNKTSVNEATNEDPWSDIKLLKQEIEDSNMQNRLMEETYLTLFRSLVDEFHVEMLSHHIHFLIKEGMYENYIIDMKTEWNERTGSEKCDTFVAKATIQDPDYAHNSIPANDQPYCLEDQTFRELGQSEATTENTSLEELVCPDYLFRALWNEIYEFLLQEILWEWNENIETFKSISCLGEEICFIVYGEIVRHAINTSNSALIKLQEIKFDDKFFETASMSIKDDVLKVFLADMIKDLQMKIYAFSLESFIREDILQLVIVESVKQGCILEEVDDHKDREPSPNNSMISVDNLRHTLDRLVKFFEDEEALMLTAYSGTKQKKTCLQHVESGFDPNEHFPEIFTYDRKSTNSADIKLEKAVLQMDYGKALLSELGSQLGITVNILDPLIATENCRKPSIDETIETFLLDISQTMKSFEFESLTRLGRHVSRLDAMKGQLDIVAQINASLIQKETLYRKAFTRRCENLQIAEAEVDLLGDQVEQLIGLLMKIYVKLHQLSPVLHHYFEVSEMLKLIEKEIGGRL